MMKKSRMASWMAVMNIFAISLAVVVFSPVHLQAEEPAKAGDSGARNSVVLSPEYFRLGIKYSNSMLNGYISSTTTVELAEVIGTPVWEVLGPQEFSDGTVASQVFSLSFTGNWDFVGELKVYDDHFMGRSREKRACYLVFALEEQEDGGARWRIFAGTLPVGRVTPDSEMVMVYSEDWGACLGAGTNSIFGNFPLHNELGYFYNEPHPEAITTVSQALIPSEYVSEYPAFALLSTYEIRLAYTDSNTDFDNMNISISLETGKKEPGMETVGVIQLQ